MAGMDIDVDELRIAAEDLLPAVAGFFDNLATDLGGIGTSAISGLLPEDTTGGNALGEAVVEAHKFLYGVLEESGDVHRSAGRMVSEACDLYEEADAESAGEIQISAGELNDSYDSAYEKIDAGDYEGSSDAPVDGSEYDLSDSKKSYGEEMTDAYAEMYGIEPED